MQLHPLPPNQVGRSQRGLWKEDRRSVGSEPGLFGRHPRDTTITIRFLLTTPSLPYSNTLSNKWGLAYFYTQLCHLWEMLWTCSHLQLKSWLFKNRPGLWRGGSWVWRAWHCHYSVLPNSDTEKAEYDACLKKTHTGPFYTHCWDIKIYLKKKKRKEKLVSVKKMASTLGNLLL